MDSPVTKIKERLSIEEVVSSYIKIERAGNSLKARCPFHDEKTPSFFISPDRGTYYCFGCSAKGDIFTFVEEFEGLDFKGALKLLADKAGVSLDSYNYNKNADNEKEKLYKVMEEATSYFCDNLEDSKEVLDYLKHRGLKDETIKDFRIGFAKSDWQALYSHLKSRGFGEKEIEIAGLIKKSEKPNSSSGQGFYDRFRGRIMFPISDTSGRVIAFSGRIFESVPTPEEVGKPISQAIVGSKYLNSPDTPIFKKSSILYGLDKAKLSIRKNNFSIIVEGQFDLILSHQAGFKNTVATSGTALADGNKNDNESVNNLGVISRLSSNVIFIFDSDKAGFAASIRATPIALALFSDMNVKATQMPDGMDPADLISKNGVDAWREVIRNSKHIIEFLVDKYIMIHKDSDPLKVKLEIEEKIIPYLTLINNPIKKSHFISLISNKSGISENDIREKLKKIEQESKYEGVSEQVKSSPSQEFRKDYIKRRLLGVIFWQKSLSEPRLNVKDVLREMAEILNTTEEKLLKQKEYNQEDLIFEAEVFYEKDADLEKDVGELLRNLHEEYLKEELERKMRELHTSEEAKDTIRSTQILKECQIINEKIQNIKSSH